MNYAGLFSELSQSATSRAAPSTLGLSEEQFAALQAPFTQSAIVCAGAGAGKTRLLTERVAALLKAGADPSRIAVVTFTRKAAKEIITRVQSRVGLRAKLPYCGTVHGLALSVLTRRRQAFNLLPEDREAQLIGELIVDKDEQFEGLAPREIIVAMHRCREQQDYNGVLGQLAEQYEALLELEEAQDFTALLSKACSKTMDWFDHILVDETQDLSSLQLTFLRTIGPKARFWFIGDPDQAIYSFRGSEPSMMHKLRAECEGFYVLSKNYRSALNIVSVANNVISFNEARFPIKWTAHRTDEGVAEVEVYQHGEFELAAVAQWLAAKPGTRCALARTQAMLLALKEAGLPAMSVHESKGLEWDEVWVMGCEAALFPHPLGAREEERRLFYVAMTRARNHLRMSYCLSRSHKNPQKQARHPCTFLYEAQALQAKS